MHTLPGPHRTPHAPQFCESVWKSAHTPEQAASPCGQTHAPPVQLAPDGHCVPQPPQLNGSLAVVTQASVQSVRPAPHDDAHAPPEQT